MRRHRLHGLSLVEILVLVLSLGFIAAIAVPNLVNAIHRGKQKETLRDMRTVATAVESYSIDHEAYPLLVGQAPVERLIPFLQPTYIKAVPLVDGWGGQLLYETANGQSYVIVSLAKDGVPSGPTTGTTTDFRHDIVFDTGSFTVVPEGTRG
ncbi:MAG: type II secretion system protein [Acidobacteriota bacterium]